MHEVQHLANDDVYRLRYDDEDGGKGVVTVCGANEQVGASLPYEVLIMLLSAYQLDARFDHFERRPVDGWVPE